MVAPYLLSIINCSLETGIIPDPLIHATVWPLLKKTSLDPTFLAIFRPFSNMSFITKIMEKTVLEQLQTYLADNNTFEVFQSGFKKQHSIETALNDLLIICDSGDLSALVLLDLTAAFDTVDHAIFV